MSITPTQVGLDGAPVNTAWLGWLDTDTPASRHAEQIVLLDHGQIVEQGTHHQLIAAHGRYANLYAIAASGYRDR